MFVGIGNSLSWRILELEAADFSPTVFRHLWSPTFPGSELSTGMGLRGMG